jgi:S-adenosylmethionine hydrolase
MSAPVTLCKDRRVGAPVISFLTDYGWADGFVGICHGVIALGCPQARVIDLSHGIAAHDVRAGALTLARALPYLPLGVHLADVDAADRGPRRDVAVRCGDGRWLVGPDNGLLWPAAQAAGGAMAMRDLAGSRWAREPVAATFHGRDVLAPVAAALAAGAAADEIGEPVDPATLRTLALPVPEWRGDAVLAHVLSIDRFGNLELDAGPDELAALGVAGRICVTAGPHRLEVAVGETFGEVDPGELVLYVDPQARLAVAVNRGDARRRLGVSVDAIVTLTALPGPAR